MSIEFSPLLKGPAYLKDNLRGDHLSHALCSAQAVLLIVPPTKEIWLALLHAP